MITPENVLENIHHHAQEVLDTRGILLAIEVYGYALGEALGRLAPSDLAAIDRGVVRYFEGMATR